MEAPRGLDEVCSGECFRPEPILQLGTVRPVEDERGLGSAAVTTLLAPLSWGSTYWVGTERRPADRPLLVAAMRVLPAGLLLTAVGVALALGANLSFAVGVVLTKALPTPSDRVASTGWQLLLGVLVIVPLAILAEGAPPRLDGDSVIGFAYISLLATGLAAALWFNGIRRLPAQAPPLLGLASAATGVALCWLLPGQSLAPSQLVGFLVTVSAIAYGATLGGGQGPRPSRPAIAPVVRTHAPYRPR